MQKITMSYLINYLSCMPFSLSLFSTSISLSSTCMSLWLLHCWQSQNSEQLSPGLTQLHLFIYLLFIYCALCSSAFVACCLQSLIRCDFYSSWKHERSHWLFSFISLPTIFTWIQLGWNTSYRVFPHDCNIVWLLNVHFKNFVSW